jgi:hypothetical protein
MMVGTWSSRTLRGGVGHLDGSRIDGGVHFQLAWVAQSVEQRTRNAQVRSSNLLSGSKSAGEGVVGQNN